MTDALADAKQTPDHAALSVHVHDRMEPLETAWRLIEADPLNSLHQGYDWCRAWVLTHQLPLAILEGRFDGQTAFILPLEIPPAQLFRKAQFIGARFSNINTGLIASECRPALAALGRKGLSDAITSALQDKADLLWLANMPLDWRGVRHPFAGLNCVENQNRAFQLDLHSTMEETIAPLNAKRRRKKYRNQVRKIEAAGGFQHLRAQEPIERQALLNLFFEQKRTRFEAMGLPDAFRAAETQAFFHLLAEADRGGSNVPLELHAIKVNLEQGEKIAAISGLSRKGDHVICQFGSIDPDCLPEASPGELLFWLMIEKTGADGAHLFDFGIGDQDYKRSWCTMETVHHDILLPVSLKGRIAAGAQRMTTRGKALIKSNPRLYGILQRLRARRDKPQTTAPSADD